MQKRQGRGGNHDDEEEQEQEVVSNKEVRVLAH